MLFLLYYSTYCRLWTPRTSTINFLFFKLRIAKLLLALFLLNLWKCEQANNNTGWYVAISLSSILLTSLLPIFLLPSEQAWSPIDFGDMFIRCLKNENSADEVRCTIGYSKNKSISSTFTLSSALVIFVDIFSEDSPTTLWQLSVLIAFDWFDVTFCF